MLRGSVDHEAPSCDLEAYSCGLGVEQNWNRIFAVTRSGELLLQVTFLYYLEDDTLLVSEPKQDNSGLPQVRHSTAQSTGEL